MTHHVFLESGSVAVQRHSQKIDDEPVFFGRSFGLLRSHRRRGLALLSMGRGLVREFRFPLVKSCLQLIAWGLRCLDSLGPNWKTASFWDLPHPSEFLYYLQAQAR